MPSSDIKPADALTLLNSPSSELRETAEWIIARHPDWGDQLHDYFRDQFQDIKQSPAAHPDLLQRLSAFTSSDSIQRLLGDILADETTPGSTKMTVLQAMRGSSLQTMPTPWLPGVRSSLRDSDPSIVQTAIETTRTLPTTKAEASYFKSVLGSLLTDPNQPADIRLAAACAIPGGPGALNQDVFSLAVNSIDAQQPIRSRTHASQLLATADLTGEQQLQLITSLGRTGPLELSRLLTAFEKRPNDEVGIALVDALQKTRSLASLRQDQITALLAKYSPAVQSKGARLFVQLNISPAKQKARLETLLKASSDGDIRRGQAVFASSRAACSSCHALGYLGGKLGPDLTRIGQIRTERDLLEAIVYPSSSFVRSYEPMIIETNDGEEHSGIISEDRPDRLILVTGPETELRLERAQIREMRPGTLSVMPAGMDEQLTRQELADLVAFLKDRR